MVIGAVLFYVYVLLKSQSFIYVSLSTPLEVITTYLDRPSIQMLNIKRWYNVLELLHSSVRY